MGSRVERGGPGGFRVSGCNPRSAAAPLLYPYLTLTLTLTLTLFRMLVFTPTLTITLAFNSETQRGDTPLEDGEVVATGVIQGSGFWLYGSGFGVNGEG